MSEETFQLKVKIGLVKRHAKMLHQQLTEALALAAEAGEDDTGLKLASLADDALLLSMRCDNADSKCTCPYEDGLGCSNGHADGCPALE